MASLYTKTTDFFLGRKSADNPQTISSEQVRQMIASEGRQAGEDVNRTTALEASVVLACAKKIAQGLAQASCKVMKEDVRGSLIEAREHPLFLLLNRKPNDWQTSFEFREQIGLHLVLDGNAFIYKNVVNGKIAELYAFMPECVEVKRDNATFDITYVVQGLDGKRITIPAESMWHIKGLSLDGLRGIGGVKLARRSIGLTLATETFGSKLFENGARPGGILTTRTGAATPTAEQREAIKRMWTEQYQGAANAHRTAILPFDLDFISISGSANDAQWIESRKFLVEEICRAFDVQPIMVMQTGATSYASVEQLFLNHVVHTLMPWYERFEQSADANLLTAAEIAEGMTVKLNANALLRGSTQERTTYYEKMISLGVMTPNEVRAREDMPLSSDPDADKLRAAANLFGQTKPTAPTDNNDNNEVSK